MRTLPSRTLSRPLRHLQSLVVLALTLTLTGCCCGGGGEKSTGEKSTKHLPFVTSDVDSDLEVLTPYAVRLADVVALEGKDGRTVEYQQTPVAGGSSGGLGRVCAHIGPACLVVIPLSVLGLGAKDKLVTVMRAGQVEFVGSYDPAQRFVKGWWREGDTLHELRTLELRSLEYQRLVVEMARGPAGNWPQEMPPLMPLPRPLLLERFTQGLSRAPPNSEVSRGVLTEATSVLGDEVLPLAESVRESRPADFLRFLSDTCPGSINSPLSLEAHRGLLARLAQRHTPAEAMGVLDCFYMPSPGGLPREGARAFLTPLAKALCREAPAAWMGEAVEEHFQRTPAASEALQADLVRELSTCPDIPRRTLARLRFKLEVHTLTARELDAVLASEAMRRGRAVEWLSPARPSHAEALLRAWRRNHLSPEVTARALHGENWRTELSREHPVLHAESLALARAVLLQQQPAPCAPAVHAASLEVLKHAARLGTVPQGYVAQLVADERTAPEPVRRRLLMARMVLGEFTLAGELARGVSLPSSVNTYAPSAVRTEDQVLPYALWLVGCSDIHMAWSVAEALDAGHTDVLCARSHR